MGTIELSQIKENEIFFGKRVGWLCRWCCHGIQETIEHGTAYLGIGKTVVAGKDVAQIVQASQGKKKGERLTVVDVTIRTTTAVPNHVKTASVAPNGSLKVFGAFILFRPGGKSQEMIGQREIVKDDRRNLEFFTAITFLIRVGSKCKGTIVENKVFG